MTTASASSHELKLPQALSLDSGKLKAPASPGFFLNLLATIPPPLRVVFARQTLQLPFGPADRFD
jgi:hypothetical protein